MNSFSNLKAIRAGVSLVWLARQPLMQDLTLKRFIYSRRRQNSKFTLPAKFNFGSLFQLFTKNFTHENNPLYGIQILIHVPKQPLCSDVIMVFFLNRWSARSQNGLLGLMILRIQSSLLIWKLSRMQSTSFTLRFVETHSRHANREFQTCH